MRRISAVLALCAVVAAGAASIGTSAAAEQRNIVRTAVTAGKFETLTGLVKEAGLARTLRRDGPFTVFAPTDRAFSKVPDSTLEELAADKEKLRAVLLHHVVAGKLRARKLVQQGSVETLNDDSLHIQERDGKVRVAGARVVIPNVGASNGVIHAINEVLIPE